MLIILCKERHAENLNRGSDRADGVELGRSGSPGCTLGGRGRPRHGSAWYPSAQSPACIPAPGPCWLCSWPELGLPASSVQWEILEVWDGGNTQKAPREPDKEHIRVWGDSYFKDNPRKRANKA